MFPPFPQEIAHHYCCNLISQIEKGEVGLQQIAQESTERAGQGLMIGSLVCWNPNTKSRVILYSVSGNSKIPVTKNHAQNEIFVPSLVSPEKINKALEENDLKIHQLTDKINEIAKKLRNEKSLAADELKKLQKKIAAKRTKLTTQSLKKVFSLYDFTRFDGKKISLNQIIKEHKNKLPPTGTGDCCAPKLLSYAFENGLEPVSMDEVFYGRSAKSKINGQSYPPCDERCGYILPSILGVEILYRDNDIIVINKQSGLLSVPGKESKKSDCAESRIKKLFPYCITQPATHRLDMETSGILILAFNKESHRNLNMQFSQGKIKKKYVALLDGILHGKQKGHLELKFRLDAGNRPYQIYDEVNGKLGITDWEKIRVQTLINPETGLEKKVTRIEFFPQTGKTHQLRLAASNKNGLGIPIVGDTLYGRCLKGEHLMLHAAHIEFIHPASKELMTFDCPPDF